MREFLTWNVLHRVHAENWRESIPDVFPDEADRIGRITGWLKARLGPHAVVCLQEVSGDQLASLRASLKHVHSFEYPRRPRLKTGGPAPLNDATEHLVVIAEGAEVCFSGAFSDDPGKGYLGVELDGLLVVSAHITWGERRTKQLATIRECVGARDCALLGDFNASASDVLSDLGVGWSLAALGAGALPTRPRPRPDAASKSTTIDHVALRGLAATSVAVVDVGGLSDHNLVRALVGR